MQSERMRMRANQRSCFPFPLLAFEERAPAEAKHAKGRMTARQEGWRGGRAASKGVEGGPRTPTLHAALAIML